MRNHRITDEHAAALLNGHLPEAREDLRQVADLVGVLRLASFEAPPQPSAALAARLDLDRLAWVSAAQGTGVPGCDTERTPVPTPRPAKGKVKTALGWFTGLGLAAQLALGAGAVSASAAGMGMAGVLPPVAQEVFDTVVATVASADELFGGVFVNADPDGGPGQGADDARTGVDGNGTDQGTQEDAGTGAGGTGVQAGEPGHTGKPDIGKPEKAEKPDKQEKPEDSGKAEKPDKPANPEKSESADQAQKPGKADDAKPAKDDVNPAPGGDPNGKIADKAPSAGESREKAGSTNTDKPGGAPAPDAGDTQGDKAKADEEKPVKDSSAG